MDSRVTDRTKDRGRAVFVAAWALTLAASLFAGAANGAAQREAWIDAYQSSPADYDFVIPKDLVLPAEARERLRDRPPVTGTLRMRFTVGMAGRQVRIRVSNEEGTQPLFVAAASVGIAADGFDARQATLRRLTFSGRGEATIAPGSLALSDPVDLPVAAMEGLVVSLDLPKGLKLKAFGNAVMAFAAGDQTLSAKLFSSDTIIGRPPASGALVLGDASTRVIVALGDSITDGTRPRLGQLHGGPEQLQRRFAARAGRPVVVVNAGIGGNRVLSTSWGKSAIARFDRDVSRIRGVSHVVMLEGINDIGFGGSSKLMGQHPPLDIQDVIAAYRQVAARAHVANIKVIFATLTPFGGSTSFTPEREAQRETLNRWIRTTREADGYIDFDAVARDPADSQRLRPEYDSGDHIHPSDAGYRAMGNSIDLARF
jgi:lysophospholipase L1-like esterase